MDSAAKLYANPDSHVIFASADTQASTMVADPDVDTLKAQGYTISTDDVTLQYFADHPDTGNSTTTITGAQQASGAGEQGNVTGAASSSSAAPTLTGSNTGMATSGEPGNAGGTTLTGTSSASPLPSASSSSSASDPSGTSSTSTGSGADAGNGALGADVQNQQSGTASAQAAGATGSATTGSSTDAADLAVIEMIAAGQTGWQTMTGTSPAVAAVSQLRTSYEAAEDKAVKLQTQVNADDTAETEAEHPAKPHVSHLLTKLRSGEALIFADLEAMLARIEDSL